MADIRGESRAKQKREVLVGPDGALLSKPAGNTYEKNETVTVSSTAIGLTPATYEGFENCLITIETDSIRFWLDGSIPTAAVGHMVYATGQILLQSPAEMQKFLAVRVSTDATLRVSYGR